MCDNVDKKANETDNKKYREIHFQRVITMQLINQSDADLYVKVESERLRYMTLNKSRLRSENYIISNNRNVNPNNLGEMDNSPSLFLYSLRLHEYTQTRLLMYLRSYRRSEIYGNIGCRE